MGFKKINDTEYFSEEPTSLINEAKEVLASVSGDVNKYPEVLNNTLFNTILSRIVTREFFKEIVLEEKQHYVTIKVQVNNSLHITTVGKMMMEEKEYILNGVLQQS